MFELKCDKKIKYFVVSCLIFVGYVVFQLYVNLRWKADIGSAGYYMEHKQYLTAANRLQDALWIRPPKLKGYDKQYYMLSTIYRQLGDAYRKEKRFTTADQWYRKSILIDNDQEARIGLQLSLRQDAS